MIEYELWLDESGDFEQESQMKGQPSLVGGVLIEKEQLTEQEITELVNADANHGVAHATSMDEGRCRRLSFLHWSLSANGVDNWCILKTGNACIHIPIASYIFASWLQGWCS